MAFAIVPQLATVTYQQILSVYKYPFRFEGSFEAAVYGIYQTLYKEADFPGLSAIEDSIRLKTILIQTMETPSKTLVTSCFRFTTAYNLSNTIVLFTTFINTASQCAWKPDH